MKKLLLNFKFLTTALLLFVLFFTNGSFAQKTWDGSSSANWNTAANWTPSGVPTATDDVIIPNGVTATITVNTAAVCSTFTMNTGGTANTVQISAGNSLTVTGAIVINDGTGNGDNKTLDVATGTLSCGSLDIQHSNAGTNRDARLLISSGTVNVTGDILMQGIRSTITFSGAGTLNVGGNFESGGIFTRSTGTVNYNGSGNQSIGAYTYYNLTTSGGSGTKSLVANTIVNGGNLNIGSGTTLDLLTYTCNRSTAGGTLTVAGTLALGATTGGQTGSNFPTNFSTLTMTGGTVNYKNLTGGQTVYATPAYNNLTLSNTSGTQTRSANITVNGNLTTTAGGTFNMGTNQLLGTLSGTITNDGIIRTQNTGVAIPTGKTWGGSGTVQYDGAGQSVSAGTYANLTLTGSSTKAIVTGTTINGNLSISGATANVGAGLNIPVGSLTLGGLNKINGTWGATTSSPAATNQDNTYFNTAGTGRITVTTDTRPTALFSSLTASQTICFGTATTTLSGVVSNGGVYAVNGNNVVVTINGSSQNAAIAGGVGAFSVSFSTAAIPASVTPYPIQYAYTGDANLSAATNNTSTSLTVNATTVGGTVTGGTTICEGSTSGLLTLAGNNGTIVRWESSVSPFSSWTTIANTVATYTSGALTQTTQFRAVVQNGVCLETPSIATTVTVNTAATANAGSNQTVCSSVPNVTLAGSVGGSASSGTWSGGTGTFSPNDTTLTATYNPSPAEIAAGGNITLTLTTDDPAGPCPAVFSTMVVTINLAPTTTGVSICPGDSGSLTASTVCALGSPINTAATNAGTGTNVTGVGATAWTNPGNITAVGTPYATAAMPINGTSNYLQATNYGFSIPANATINGIQVIINRTGNQLFGVFGVRDVNVKLVKDVAGSPVIQTTNKAIAGNWPTTLGTATYGTTTDLWSATWTAADINNTNFGVALSVDSNIGFLTTPTATVDYMQITVTYQVPGSIEWYTASSGGSAIGTGSSFNPAGVPGSGLADTLTPGTTIYYAACADNPTCRQPTNFVINPNPTPGTVSGGTAVCTGSTSSLLTLSGYSGTIVRWESSVSPFSSWSTIANTLATYTSGALTQDTQFRAVLQTGTCELPSVATTVTVDPISAVGVVSDDQSACIGGSLLNDITIASATGTIQWESADDAGFTSGLTNLGTNSTTLTIAQVGVLTTPKFFRAIVTSGLCSSATSATVSVTIDPLSTVGAVSVDQSICNGNSLNNDITIASATGTIQWQKDTDPGFSVPVNIGSDSTTLTIAQVGALTATTYFRAVVTSGVCSSATSATVTVTVGTTKTYSGGSWTPSAPTSIDTAIISGNYTSSGDLDACSLTVDSSAIVTISSGDNVTLTGALTVTSGSFTLENTANLLQTTNAANSGNIIVNRNSSALKRLDYTMWSSPVTGSQTLLNFSPFTSSTRFYEYVTSTNLYAGISSSNTFDLGKGYLIRMPNNWTTWANVWSGQFTGVPNNGNINHTMSLSGTGFNAVGNPYPSALDIDAFITANTLPVVDNIDGTLWFWRKTNDSLNPVSYSTCTISGCTLNNGAVSDGITISTGQGFIVKAMSTTLNYTNSMRSGSNVNQFFKTAEKNRYWLELTNSDKVSFGQNLIAYLPNATLGYDNGYDGLFINDTKTTLLTNSGDKEVVIQARPEFDAQDVLPLIIKVETAGTYTITLSDVDGIFEGNQNIYLNDRLENKSQNLSEGNYTFTADAGNFTSRFDITYQKALGVNQTIFNENNIVVYKQSQDMIINTGTTMMSTVKVYDLQGRLLVAKKNINASQTKITTGTTNQVLLVKITSVQNGTITKKVMH